MPLKGRCEIIKNAFIV